MSGVVTCAAHPDVETALRCSKCDKPICPRCLVQTPVGARCRECAQLRRLPTFDLRPALFLRAVGIGVLAAIVVGGIWGSLPFAGFLGLFLGAIAGYLIGEVVSRGANRRRSVYLKVVAALCVVLAYAVSEVGGLLVMSGSPGLILPLLVRTFVVSPMAWLIVALGAFIATTRID